MMIDRKSILVFNIPDQKALVVGLAVILLDSRTAIAHSTFSIKNLICLVNVPKHCEVVTSEDANVMIAMIHDPANVR